MEKQVASNAFDFFNTHIPDVWSIFGITSPKIIHLFYIGLCVYLCKGFIFQISEAMKKYLDASGISLHTNNKCQSLGGMLVLLPIKMVLKVISLLKPREKIFLEVSFFNDNRYKQVSAVLFINAEIFLVQTDSLLPSQVPGIFW